MERIANSIKEYQRTFGNRNDNKGAFYATDIKDVKTYTQKRLIEKGDITPDMATYIFDIIGNALEAGFMIGYRCAKNETRKANATRK